MESLGTPMSECLQASLLAVQASATTARVLCPLLSGFVLWMDGIVVALFAMEQRDNHVAQKNLGTEPRHFPTAVKEAAFSEPSPLDHQVLHFTRGCE